MQSQHLHLHNLINATEGLTQVVLQSAFMAERAVCVRPGVTGIHQAVVREGTEGHGSLACAIRVPRAASRTYTTHSSSIRLLGAQTT